MQTFKSASLGFSISYPDTWQLVPAAWTRQFIGRAKNTSEKLAEYLAAGSPPFLAVQDPHVPAGLAIPALKCQAYSSAAIANAGGLGVVLGNVVDRMNEAFPDFELHEFSPECVLAGSIGGRLTASMSVINSEGESYKGHSELLFLPTSYYVFAVGLSATADLAYRPEEALSSIKRSIRLRSS